MIPVSKICTKSRIMISNIISPELCMGNSICMDWVMFYVTKSLSSDLTTCNKSQPLLTLEMDLNGRCRCDTSELCLQVPDDFLNRCIILKNSISIALTFLVQSKLKVKWQKRLPKIIGAKTEDNYNFSKVQRDAE